MKRGVRSAFAFDPRFMQFGEPKDRGLFWNAAQAAHDPDIARYGVGIVVA